MQTKGPQEPKESPLQMGGLVRCYIFKNIPKTG